jgi:lipopolysaccharide biosynthesis glycosyltransferase
MLRIFREIKAENSEKLRSDDIAQMYAHKVSKYLVDSEQEDNTPVQERWRYLPYSVS